MKPLNKTSKVIQMLEIKTIGDLCDAIEKEQHRRAMMNEAKLKLDTANKMPHLEHLQFDNGESELARLKREWLATRAERVTFAPSPGY